MILNSLTKIPVYMPTIGQPPTHLSTQAVGVALLHQFARDRFREENLQEGLIEEAEQEICPEICEIFATCQDANDNNQSDANQDGEISISNLHSDTQRSLNLSNAQQDSSNQTTTPILTTRLSTTNVNLSVGPLNSTVKPHDYSTDEPTFHSMALSNDNSTRVCQSMTNSNTTLIHANDQQEHQRTQPYQQSKPSTQTETTNEVTHGDSIYHSMNTTGQKRIKTPNTTTASVDGDNSSNTCHQHNNLRAKPNLDKHLDSTFRALGESLRKVADDFARSQERQRVRDQANGVGLENLNKKHFLELLDALFAGEITSERIVILFFFCVDVAVRAYSEAHHMVVELLKWSFSFIINTVCRKVEELGGWEKVLFYQVPSFIAHLCGLVGIGVLLMYIVKAVRG